MVELDRGRPGAPALEAVEVVLRPEPELAPTQHLHMVEVNARKG